MRTNDTTFADAKMIADDLFKLQQFIMSQLPECHVIISSPVNCLDDPKKAVMIHDVNVILKNMSGINLIDLSYLINLSGSTMLARNFLEKLRSL